MKTFQNYLKYYCLHGVVCSLLLLPVLTAAAPAVDAEAERAVMEQLKNLTLEQLSKVSVEYKVKAAYLFNFFQYVKWPSQVFVNEQTSFVLCIFGDDPFGSAFEPLEGRTVRGTQRTILITYLFEIEDADTCHMLFISRSERDALPDILPYLEKLPVLTTSDIPDFARKGGMIGFALREGTIRLDIGLKPVEKAGLTLRPALRKFRFARYF